MQQLYSWLVSRQHNMLAHSHSRLCYTGRHPVKCASLPSIRDFIKQECPIKGFDGTFREQSREGTIQAACIGVEASHLVVPGQRRLYKVSNQTLEQIVADQGQVVVCPFSDNKSNDFKSNITNRKLASPAKGSWACLAMVAGLQRLPGSDEALVRVLVSNRVAVQALHCSTPSLTRCQAAPLRDRWAYFVRTAALEECLSTQGGAGQDVQQAVQQVQDACGELLQLLQQVADGVQSVVDAPSSPATAETAVVELQELLVRYEVADELNELLAWCQLAGPMDQPISSSSSSSSSGNGTVDGNLIPAMEWSAGTASGTMAAAPDGRLMELAWRTSFAPYAAHGLAAVLGTVSVQQPVPAHSSQAAIRESLETMDLGMRLEAGLELMAHWRSAIGAQLALAQIET